MKRFSEFVCEYNYVSPKYTVLKELTVNGVWYCLRVEDKYPKTLEVRWNPKPEIRSFTREEYLKPTKKKGIYSNGQNWDEFDEAVKVLGGKMLDISRSYTSDWGDGDTDVFTTHYYDMDDVLDEVGYYSMKFPKQTK